MPKKPEVSLETLRPATALALRGETGPTLPSKYSDALHFSIVDNVAKGMLPKDAAILAGITSQDWYNWKRAVEAGVAHPKLAKLFDDIENSDALDRANKMAAIMAEPSKEDLKWMLAHRHAKEFGKQEVKIMVEQQLTAAIDKLVMAAEAGKISFEVLQTVIDIIATET